MVRLRNEIVLMFQFTHPGRGATDDIPVQLSKENVSIHAPREGCDLFSVHSYLLHVVFQFTHPGRGATFDKFAVDRVLDLFQFTHPGRGAT